MKTYNLQLQGTSLVATITEGDQEWIEPFSIINHQIRLSKSANSLMLQKGNYILSMPVAQIATYNTYALIKAQLLVWISTATLSVDNVEFANVSIDGTTLASQATLLALLNKVIAAPSTEAKQDVLNTAIAAGLTTYGKSKNITPVINTSAPAYSIGDCIGGVLTLTNAARAAGLTTLLQSMHIKDDLNQKAALTILIFNANPTGDAGFVATDNLPFVYGTAAYQKQIGIISIASSDYITINGKASAPISGLGRVYTTTADSNLYAVIIAGSTPTYAANNTSLALTSGFLQD